MGAADFCLRPDTGMLIRFDKGSEYHFTTSSTYEKQQVLAIPGIPEIILDFLNALRKECKLLVHGFVIMPNHLHLVWHIPLETGISRAMKLLKGRTSRHILALFRADPDFEIGTLTKPNGRLALWLQRYHDFNILTEDKLREKIDYCHFNPVRWGLVKSPEEWPYSSFRSWYDLNDSVFDIDRF